MGKKSKKGVSRAGSKKHPAAGQGVTRRKSSMSEDGGSRASREDLSAAMSVESMPSLSNTKKLPNLLPRDVLLNDEKGDFDKENSVDMPSPLGNGDVLMPTTAPAKVVAATVQDEEAKRKAIEKMVAEELVKRKAEEASKKKKEEEAAAAAAVAAAAAAKKKEDATPKVKNSAPPTQRTETETVKRNIEPAAEKVAEKPAAPHDEVFSRNLREKVAEDEANAPAVLDVTIDEDQSPMEETEKAPVTESAVKSDIASRGLVDLSAPAPKEAGMKQKDCACLIL